MRPTPLPALGGGANLASTTTLDTDVATVDDRCYVAMPGYRFRTIIVPINVSNQHWILVAFNRPNETIYLYDSLAPSISSEQRGMVAGPRGCCAALAEHLACTYDASLTT
jgi:hypothetical protein